MIHHAIVRHFLVLGAGLTVVAVWVNTDAAPWSELAPNLDITWVHQLNQVFHDDIHAVLVEVSMVAEAEQIQLQGLAFHHINIGNVADVNGGKVRLTGDRTKAGELRAVELDKVVVARMLVVKGFQHFRCVVAFVGYILVSQQGQTLLHSFHCCASFFCKYYTKTY